MPLDVKPYEMKVADTPLAEANRIMQISSSLKYSWNSAGTCGTRIVDALSRLADHLRQPRRLLAQRRLPRMVFDYIDGGAERPVIGRDGAPAEGMGLAESRRFTIAVPGATGASLSLPENGQKGGVWVMNPGTTTAHLMIPGE